MPPSCAANACDALLARGHTADAAALIDPLITGPPDLDNWPVHERRAEIDLLRGDIAAAEARQQQITALIGHLGSSDVAREAAQRAAELALWAGRPGDALAGGSAGPRPVHGPGPDDLLRAAAGGGHARLRRPGRAGPCPPRRHRSSVAVDAASELVSWADRMAGAPFTDHPSRGDNPGGAGHLERRADPPGRRKRPRCVERGRENLAGPGLPAPGRVRVVAARRGAARPPASPPAAATALRAAAAAADGHAPLLAEVRKLAERARIPLPAPSAALPAAPAAPNHPRISG